PQYVTPTPAVFRSRTHGKYMLGEPLVIRDPPLGAAMEVTFVRVPETVCEGVVRFDDGRVLSVRSPGALRTVPPHDLGQFVVEHELGWQTGFWGYVTRGVLFPGVTQTAGRRAFHRDERSRAAIRGAKDLLAEVEMLAGVVGAIALAHADDDPDRVAAMLRDTW